MLRRPDQLFFADAPDLVSLIAGLDDCLLPAEHPAKAALSAAGVQSALTSRTDPSVSTPNDHPRCRARAAIGSNDAR